LKWQNGLVLVASYFFYGWWSWKFMGLLMLSTALNYTYGLLLKSSKPNKAKTILWLSIVSNFGLLIIFKYYNFFAFQFQQGLELLGLQTNPILLNLGIPIGISFYTLYGLSYVFDIYRRQQVPILNFIEFAVSVSFFPLIMSGPIEQSNNLLPQVQKSRLFNYQQTVEGCRLILWGLFKKVVIADSLAKIANPIFENYTTQNGILLIFGAIAYSFQIYGDFSGYSDIAIGVAKLFGFELLSNFKFPYFSRDIGEFWKRWHISLTNWLRNYIYLPLGGSKNGRYITFRNIVIVFLFSGIWHGASWNFIAWGFLNACGFLPLIVLNTNKKYQTEVVAQNRKTPNLTEIRQMISTFAFVTCSRIFFKLPNINDSFSYFSRILNSTFCNISFGIVIYKILIPLFFILSFLALEWYNRGNERNPKILVGKNLVTLAIFTLIVLLHFFKGQYNTNFIYYQF
jgi:alginate O-acetyltransferase complex protein AlgI